MSEERQTICTDDHMSYAAIAHAYLRDLPKNIDFKVSTFNAVSILSLFFMIKLFYPNGQAPTPLWHNVADWLAIVDYLGLLLLCASILCSMMALRARTTGRKDGILSVVALGQHKDVSAFVYAVCQADRVDLVEAQLTHCYELSEIARDKIVWFNRSITLGFVGIVCAVVGAIS
jgi:hypothetical protein